MNQTFGEYIKQLRVRNNLTLTQLAARLGLDSANLSKIENNKREFDEKRLERLASIFELNIENVKNEYFGDQFAKKMYQHNCSAKTLSVAEEKIKYMKNKNIVHLEIDLENEN